MTDNRWDTLQEALREPFERGGIDRNTVTNALEALASLKADYEHLVSVLVQDTVPEAYLNRLRDTEAELDATKRDLGICETANEELHAKLQKHLAAWAFLRSEGEVRSTVDAELRTLKAKLERIEGTLESAKRSYREEAVNAANARAQVERIEGERDALRSALKSVKYRERIINESLGFDFIAEYIDPALGHTTEGAPK